MLLANRYMLGCFISIGAAAAITGLILSVSHAAAQRADIDIQCGESQIFRASDRACYSLQGE